MSKMNVNEKRFKDMRTGHMLSLNDMVKIRQENQNQDKAEFEEKMKAKIKEATDQAQKNLMELSERVLAGIDGDGDGKLGFRLKVESLADGRTYLNADSLAFQAPKSISDRLPDALIKTFMQKVIRATNVILADYNDMRKIAMEPLEGLKSEIDKIVAEAKEKALGSEEEREEETAQEQATA